MSGIEKSARVVEERKNYVVVAVGDVLVNATVKGIAKRNHGRILAGDIVDVEIVDAEADPPTGAVRKLHKRNSQLDQPSIANIDGIVLVTTVISPPVDPFFIDRFLFGASFQDIPVTIVFNKIDLLEDEDREELAGMISVYDSIGCQCMSVSAKTGANVEKISEHCSGKLIAFAGASGVGKSALMARLFPDAEFRTGELAKHTGRGAHTTTHTTLVPYAGSFIADTPGFSFVKIPPLGPEDAAPHFPDLAAFVGRCRFSDCLHESEPGCAVRAAADTGELSDFRYCSYLRIVEEIRAEGKSKYR